MRAEMEIPRGRFSFDQPWDLPAGSSAHALASVSDGSPSRLVTTVAAYHDGTRLYVVFQGTDQEVVATYRNHDEPLFEEDVLEIFLAPTEIARYYEIEVNPLGTTFDAALHSPFGERKSMTADLGWECPGLWAVIQRARHSNELRWSFSTVVSIPIESLGWQGPIEGSTWKGNFYRIDRSRQGDEFSAWRPTRKSPPDFHVPAEFGDLRFL